MINVIEVKAQNTPRIFGPLLSLEESIYIAGVTVNEASRIIERLREQGTGISIRQLRNLHEDKKHFQRSPITSPNAKMDIHRANRDV